MTEIIVKPSERLKKRKAMNRTLYIVWNMTNYGDGYEFFGICDTLKEADKLYSKACEDYGINPKQGFDECNSIMITEVPYSNKH